VGSSCRERGGGDLDEEAAGVGGVRSVKATLGFGRGRSSRSLSSTSRSFPLRDLPCGNCMSLATGA
jgi:hypothetical protein